MSWRRTLAKLSFLVRRKPDDLAEEIRAHLAMEEAENVAAGMDAQEARFAASRRFGNATLTQERSRDMWTWRGFETLKTDAGYGLRQLRRNPGFAIVAILTLALGIGANTAIFSVVNAVLLQPLPFSDPGRLVEGRETESAPGSYPVNPANYLDWKHRNHTMEAMTVFSWTTNASMAGPNEPAAAGVTPVESNFFQTLGISPIIGRSFAPGEDVAGRNRIAILTYGFWQREFAGDAGAIGRSVTLDAEQYTIVGVMPPTFHFPSATDIWVPLDMKDKMFTDRGNHGLNVIGRLKRGVTLAQARQDLLGISLQLEKEYPNGDTKVHAMLFPLKARLVGGAQQRLLVLLGSVALVLLIACVNVANLLLARAGSRQREIALRASLGAGRLRLLRQLITESIVLALAGALLGSLGAWWILRTVDHATIPFVPHWNRIGLDSTVLLFTLLISVLSALLFGLAPALQISRTRLTDSLKAAAQAVVGAGVGRQRLRDVLMFAEIAITLALLAGAGLLLRSFEKLQAAGIGVDSRNLLTATINLPEVNYAKPAQRRAFVDELLERSRRIPGVTSAAFSSEIPLLGGSNGYIKVDGVSDPALADVLIGHNYVTADYFSTFGIAVARGRRFNAEDMDHDGAAIQKLNELYAASPNGAPKVPPDLTLHAIISKTAARVFWKKQDPLGRTFHWNGAKVVVVGIVDDVKEYGIRAETMPQAYFPSSIALSYDNAGYLTLRTAIAPTAVLPALRRTLQGLDRGLALMRPRTMAQLVADDTSDARVQTILLASFAVLALVLAAVGLYGVMSYTVVQRTREIGIRMAIGARGDDVLRMILFNGLRLTLAGVAGGLLLASALSRAMTGLLFGTPPFDPLTFGCAAALLATVATAAYAIPALRATHVDPMRALHYE